MPTESTLEKFKDRLFDDLDSIDCTPAERRRLKIYRFLFTSKLEKPYVTNAELAENLAEYFGVTSTGQAYRYISHIELLVGNVRASEKQWIRYLVVEALKEAIKLAKAKDDIKAMVSAADKLGKYTRLDQEDPEPIEWDIKPQAVEFINDPTILNLPKVSNPKEVVEKAKKRYMEAEATDIEYMEVKRDE